jgi:pyrroloquinoline-quinone synthase
MRSAGFAFDGRSEMELCARIDEARQRWDVLRHPFYERWQSGDLSRDELAFYAGEYRHAVVALAKAAAVAGDDEHAREESEHVALWDDFAAAVEAPLDREPLAETRACAAAWAPAERFQALAVLYAVESSQPAISSTKLTGLVRHYGFGLADSSAEYFRLHAERDLEHAGHAREALADAPDDEAPALAAAAERALEANWRLLDGVQRAA